MAISESGPATAEVARNIQRVRKARQLKQSEVSARLAAAGRPTLPTVVSKVERGERRIDVDDLVAFGRALGVPPALLLYPLGTDEEVEVLAGQSASTWDAFRWFVGEAPFPELGTPHGEADEATGLAEWYETAPWEEGAAPVALWRRHTEQIGEWYDVPSRTRRLRLPEAEERAERARLWGQIEDALKQTRATMRMRGLKPPRLPEELAELDA
ncbi:helix-turn-helix domain-containing protein [Streptomyces sp. NPDC056568]|uniref:helix-turn-helix domain-containing protein n=1 Tax=Streptomyces sp. NPDC056568 TaxID=3345866 RepID=UPI0036BA2D50